MRAASSESSGLSFDPFHPIYGSTLKYLDLPFLPNREMQTRLLVRPEYETLFKLVKSHYSQLEPESGCVVMGNPGIGKSVSCLNYFLVCAAMRGIPVVLQIDNPCLSIFFSHVQPPAVISYRQYHPSLNSAETLYLVDPAGHREAKEPGKCRQWCFHLRIGHTFMSFASV